MMIKNENFVYLAEVQIASPVATLSSKSADYLNCIPLSMIRKNFFVYKVDCFIFIALNFQLAASDSISF